MDCDVCGRSHNPQRLPFLCAVDARNRCYDGRLKSALAFMENESLRTQINALIDSSSSSTKKADKVPQGTQDNLPHTRAVTARLSTSEQKAAEDRTSRIIEQAEKLREDVTRARKDLADRKAVIARRKKELESAAIGLEARRARITEETERSIHALRFKWDRNAEATARTRAFLCVEAAKLFGLRRIKKAGSPPRYEYKLAGVEIIDLESMHAASPEHLSTSLANVAHILSLTSHYLSIRLPAELTLPHRDYPRPTIFTLPSSYDHDQVPFPGTMQIGAEPPNSARQHPRPRPLYVDKPLATLAKEDPAVYSLFLEGVTLLAYDIAWACNTQGISIGEKTSFEDVCKIGRNLYNLLIAQSHTPQGGKIFSATSDSQDIDDSPHVTSIMGQYSHGSAHSNLAGPQGTEFIKNFKLPTPLKIVDKLKKKLLSEVTIPEWEVLDEDAWAGADQDGQAVAAEENRKTNSRINSDLAAESRQVFSGTNGWTKVKSRQ